MTLEEQQQLLRDAMRTGGKIQIIEDYMGKRVCRCLVSSGSLSAPMDITHELLRALNIDRDDPKG